VIVPPKTSNAHLLSAWGAGIALLFLGIGLHGAGQPLSPVAVAFTPRLVSAEEIMIEEFQPPPAPAAAEIAEPVPQDPLIDEIEIPSVPEIEVPLTPPEMMELTQLEPILEKPKPVPAPQPPVGKPAAQARPPAEAPRPTVPGTSSGSGAPTLSSGSGKGRFPAPYYPASARDAGLIGTVHLQVIVEANGLPSSVDLVKSSGHPVLDTAARQSVQRRWRWPAGNVRSLPVMIHYRLE